MIRRQSMSILVGTLLLCVIPVLGNAADVLPMVIDGSGQTDHVWWVDGQHTQRTPFEQAMADSSGDIWMAPSDVASPGAISRIYQSRSLSTTDLANVGEIFSARYVLHGVLKAEQQWVPIAGEYVSMVQLEGVLIDTRTRSVIGDISVVGHGSAHKERRSMEYATERLVHTVEQVIGKLTTTDEVASNTSGWRITVRGTGTAEPYVIFRRTIRKRLHDGAHLMECSAEEGSVTLCVHGVNEDQEALRSEVERLEGTTIGEKVRVESVTESMRGVVVQLTRDEDDMESIRPSFQ